MFVFGMLYNVDKFFGMLMVYVWVIVEIWGYYVFNYGLFVIVMCFLNNFIVKKMFFFVFLIDVFFIVCVVKV